MTMTKTMPGVLAFPSSYQVMDAEEMTYVEGGKVVDTFDTAQKISAFCAKMAAAFGSSSLGMTGVATLGALAIIPGLIAGFAATLYGVMGGLYLGGYFDAQKIVKNNGASCRTRLRETLFLSVMITGVEVTKA